MKITMVQREVVDLLHVWFLITCDAVEHDSRVNFWVALKRAFGVGPDKDRYERVLSSRSLS